FGVGVHSKSDYGVAVVGSAGAAVAISADSQGAEAVVGVTAASDHAAVAGTSTALVRGSGVWGRTEGPDGIGVRGQSDVGEGSIGVYGSSVEGRGVVGISTQSTGAEGNTVHGIGVYGGVVYDRDDRPGSGRGVVGIAHSSTGVEGQSDAGVGVWGA